MLPLAGTDDSGELVVLPRAPTNCLDPTIVAEARAACLRCQAARTRAQCLSTQAIVFGGTGECWLWGVPLGLGQRSHTLFKACLGHARAHMRPQRR